MSDNISKTATVSAAPGQVSSTVEGEAVILNVDTGVYYGLNPVGAWVWEQLQATKTVDALLQGLVGEFDVDEEQGETDLMALLADLAGAGLIEVKG